MAVSEPLSVDVKMMTLVNEKLQLILEEAIFDEKAEQIFRMRYGVDCQIQVPKHISKTLKVPMKKLHLEMHRIDNKIFNILKKHDLFEQI
ncbi:hypothetical protein [Fusibacter sp. 3D3]|uniref:hypothetical protein n=1 Tax=Fusibacter sp. 3D3 TaxID=1048380 RepID=UPI000852AB8E|nr:hypothetical protein [Fusibacter sp. 3D3]GAU76858.1 hypothetical protein F3D3_1456 [Fusibacter sp. 3D3]